MIKAAVFDMDGTTLDTIRTVAHYANAALRTEGLPPIGEENYKTFVGNGAELLLRRALAFDGVTDEAVFARVYKAYNEAYDADPLFLTKPYDGIPELLSDLRRRGLFVMIFSNKPHSAAAPVAEKTLSGLFDEVRGAVPGVPLKPAPDGCLSVLAKRGIQPEEVVYIGDSGVDMRTGKAMGARRTVGVLWGFRSAGELTENGADALIAKPLDLLPYLEEI